jgi:hypothetical protein
MEITNKSEVVKAGGGSERSNENQQAPQRKGTSGANTDDETQTNTRIDTKSPVRGE